MTTPLRPDDPRRLGGYRLLARLGEGGMGAVYLAHDENDRRVALKLIRPGLAAEPEFRARFRSEVRRARQVPPFCTAAVLDADPEHPTPYLVVEYVEGPSLEQTVRRDGPMRDGSLHSVAIGVATALAAIHRAGVIHRDLKPANVLLPLGTPKVIDFGIARTTVGTDHTRPDQMVGTLAYMAPERFETGERRQPAGPPADIFAWGVLVAYAATGRTPFAADSPVATAARILTQPPDLAGVDGPIRDLVTAALAKDPADRPTAQELLNRLLTADDPAARADLAERPQLRWAALAVRDAPTASAMAKAAESWARVARGRRRRRALRIGSVIAGITALLSGLTAITVAVWPGPPPAPVAVPVDRFGRLTLADTLTGPGPWMAAGRSGSSGSCMHDYEGLRVYRETIKEYRCPGPDRTFADPIVAVDAYAGEASECAALWLRSGTEGAYRVALCSDRLTLAAEGPDPSRSTTLATAPMPPRSSTQLTRLVVALRGPFLDVTVNGQMLMRAQIPGKPLPSGRLALGVVRDFSKPYLLVDDDLARPESGDALFAGIRVWEP
ncbi:serine/threonine-protein kinase [Actinoplanes sp. GCM10030250]|uniref:serine/threonine-protein kinase n=1 Tax=Actinoplanes sp. GCM10030250 TaxID=3273376 RepID=UPI0036201F20